MDTKYSATNDHQWESAWPVDYTKL